MSSAKSSLLILQKKFDGLGKSFMYKMNKSADIMLLGVYLRQYFWLLIFGHSLSHGIFYSLDNS